MNRSDPNALGETRQAGAKMRNEFLSPSGVFSGVRE